MKKNNRSVQESRALLREFFGREIIVERKTDILYIKIANWVLNKIMAGEYYSISLNLKDNNKKFARLNSRSEYTGEYIAIMFGFFQSSELQKGFEEYARETGDDRILNTIEKFKSAFDHFTIKFYNFIADAGGTMSTHGEMELYGNFEDINNIKNKAMRTAGLDIFRSCLKQNKRIFVHEFAHYLNAIRSNYTQYRAKSGSGLAINSRAYAESTEELQAFLMESYDAVRSALVAGNKEVLSLARALNRNDFNKFLKEYLKLIFSSTPWFDRSLDASDTRPGGVGDESGVITKQGKRIVRRIYEIFEQLKEEGFDKVAPELSLVKTLSDLDNQLESMASSFVNRLQDNKMNTAVEIMNAVFKMAGVSEKSDLRTGVRGL